MTDLRGAAILSSVDTAPALGRHRRPTRRAQHARRHALAAPAAMGPTSPLPDAQRLITAHAPATGSFPAPWRAYEARPWYSLHPLRSRLLPPSLFKRRFVAPSLNATGLSPAELALAAALLAGAVSRALAQRTGDVEDSGDFAQMLVVLLFPFVTYRSLVAYVLGIPFERATFWHGFLAVLAAAYAVWHGACALFWGEVDEVDGTPAPRGLSAFWPGPHQFRFLTGLAAAVLFALTVLVSVRPVRRLAPRAWLVAHHALPLLAVAAAVAHEATSVLVGVALYLADRLFGYVYQARGHYRSMGAEAQAQVLKSGAVLITFPVNCSYLPGQFMCLQVPHVSRWEFHAFTISSIPSDQHLAFVIQADGAWTKRLQSCVTKAMAGSDGPVSMPARLHGPVGSVGLDWESERYKIFVLVAGGIGITPMMAIYRHLAEQKCRGRPVEAVELIWSTRSRKLVEDIVDAQMLARGNAVAGGLSEEGCELIVSGFDVKIFLTGDSDADARRSHVSRYRSGEEQILGCVEWNKGRPELERLLRSVQGVALSAGERRVAVMVCGPDSMRVDVCRAASRACSEAVQFDIHAEHFS